MRSSSGNAPLSRMAREVRGSKGGILLAERGRIEDFVFALPVGVAEDGARGAHGVAQRPVDPVGTADDFADGAQGGVDGKAGRVRDEPQRFKVGAQARPRSDQLAAPA